MPFLANHSLELSGLAEAVKASSINSSTTTKTAAQAIMDKYAHKQTTWEPSKNLEKFINLLHSIPNYKPSYFQRLFYKAAGETISPMLLDGCSAEEQLAALNDLDMEPPETMFLMAETARRMGKTDALTQFAAGILASRPHASIMYVSLFEPTCKLACKTTYKWFCDWKLEHRVTRTTMAITYYGDTPDDVRTLEFFSGQSANVNSIYIFYICLFIVFIVRCRADTPLIRAHQYNPACAEIAARMFCK